MHQSKFKQSKRLLTISSVGITLLSAFLYGKPVEAVCTWNVSPTYPQATNYGPDVGENTVLSSTVQLANVQAGDQVTYRWQKNTFAAQATFTDVPGGTQNITIGAANPVEEIAASLPLNNVNTQQAGEYRVVFSATCVGTTQTSPELMLYVYPRISVHPQDRVGLPGTNLTFSVTTTGTNVGYQWRWNSNNLANGTFANIGTISGVTTNTLTLQSFQLNQARDGYNVRIFNADWPTGTDRYSNYAAAILESDRPNWTAHGICQTANNGTLTSPDLNLNVGEDIQLLWNNFQNGGGSYCATTSFGSIGNVGFCQRNLTGTGGYGGNIYLNFRLPDGSSTIQSMVKTTYVYEKEQTPGVWTSVEGPYDTYYSGSSEGPDYYDYNVVLSDAGNYRLRIPNQMCVTAPQILGPLAVTVTTTPMVLANLELDGSIATPQTRRIGDTNVDFYTRITTGGEPPYDYYLEQNTGSGFVVRDQTINTTSTSQRFYLPALRKPEDNGTYRIRVVDNQNSTAFTPNTIVMNVLQRQQTADPQIPPVAYTQDGGFITTFAQVTGGDAPYTYYWETRPNSGSAWVAAPGRDTASNIYTSPILSLADNTRDYRVRVCTEPAECRTSNIQDLNVDPAPPRIVTQPMSTNSAVGQMAFFSVVATGSPTLSYQWRKDGANLPGETFPILQFLVDSPSDAGNYDVLVSQSPSGLSVTSNVAVLSLADGPNIVDHPEDAVAVLNGPSTPPFSVVVNPTTGVTYQWQKETSPGVFTNILGATNSNYFIPSTTPADAVRYRVMVTKSGISIPSQSATLSITNPPTITQQPQDVSGVAGGVVQFSVLATGTGLTYQWQKETSAGSGVYTALTDLVGKYSGATSSSLSVINIASSDALRYRVVVTNDAGLPVTSTPALLTVIQPISFSQQPQNQAVTTGANAIFNVTANGTGPITYRWHRNGNPIADGSTGFSGQNSNVLTVLSVSTGDLGNYHVVATNSAGSLPSSSASLSIADPIVIVNHPTNQSVTAGQTAVFSVIVTGSDPKNYQWRKNGSPISDLAGSIEGAATSTLRVLNVDALDEGNYSVQVSNPFGADTSNSAALSVVQPVQILVSPQNQTVIQGTNAIFSVTATGSAPLSYRWHKNGSPILDGAAGFMGQATASLTVQSVDAGDTGSYHVVVSNVVNSLPSAPATLAINNDGPTIVSHPQDVVAVQGQAAPAFTVTVNPPTGNDFVWEQETTPGSGSFAAIFGAPNQNSYTISNAQPTHERLYRVRVTRNGIPVTSNSARLTLSAPPVITQQPQSVAARLGEFAQFTVVATGTGLQYQWEKNGVVLNDLAGRVAGATSSVLTLTNLVATDAANYRVRVTNSQNQSVHSDQAALTVITPVGFTTHPQSQTLTAGANAIFSVVVTGSTPITYQWYKNGSPISNIPGEYSGATTASLTVLSINAADMGNYHVVATNPAGSLPSNAATLNVQDPVQIVGQPSALILTEGSSGSFSVAATGTAPLTYRWYRNGDALPTNDPRLVGVTGPMLQILGALASDVGSYSVRVSNPVDQRTSNSVTLTVNRPVVITNQPDNLTVMPNATANFSVEANGTNPLIYQWRKNSINLPNNPAKYVGVTTANLQVLNVQELDEGNYDVVITNPVGAVTSNAAQLLVDDQMTCEIPSVPNLSSPMDGANTGASPQFAWEAVTPQSPECGITYDLTLAQVADCEMAHASRLVFPNIATASFPLPVSLSVGQTYYWCVKTKTVGAASAYSPSRQFRVQDGQIPTPTLQITPSGTSQVFPSGQTEILVSLANGESGSLAYLYEVEGTARTLVGTQLIGAGGDADFVVGLSNTSEARRFDYQARIQRGSVFGNYSDIVSYYFDPSLIIQPAPVLRDAVDNDLVLETGRLDLAFEMVPSATGYAVYRRVGLEDCVPGPSTFCYQSTTPFRQIDEFDVASLPTAAASIDGTRIIYRDPQLSTLTIPAEGVSYFVVAINAQSRSQRSNSVSKGDTRAVTILRNPSTNEPISPRLSIRTLADGRTIEVWAQDLDGFNLDNSADLQAKVLYKAIGDVPPGVDPLSTINFEDLEGLNVVEPVVDSIRRITTDTIQNGILISRHQGIPGNVYAHLVCLKDVSDNPAGSQVGDHCFTPRLAPRLVDELAPDFAGVSDVIPLPDGHSLLVKWPQAVGYVPEPGSSVIGPEVLQYEVRFTNRFRANGEPDFSNAPFRIVEDVNTLELALEDLETDTRYAVAVQALDESENRTGSEVILEGRTLDNKPYPTRVDFELGSSTGEVIVHVDVFDRNLDRGDEVRVVGLSIGGSVRAMSVVDNLEGRVLGQNTRGLASITGNQRSTTFRLDLADTLDTELLERFYYALEVEDASGYRGRLEGQARLADGLALGATGFSNQTAGEFCGTARSKAQSPWILASFLVLMGFGVFFLRRRLAPPY